MKQINDLIICEIPKGKRYAITKDNRLAVWTHSDHSTAVTAKVTDLPSGYEYEGLCSSPDINAYNVKNILKAAGVPYANMPWTNYIALTKDNGFEPTPTTDLLFIKRIKK